MSRVFSSRPASRRGRFAPLVDRLESRELLAAKVAPQVTFTESPIPGSALYSLIVVGTNRNDTISIADDGKQAAGSLRVSTAGGLAYVSQHPVQIVQAFTGAGKDTFNYQLTGDLGPTVMEDVFASSGGRAFDQSRTVKGGGSLKATANVAGAVPAGASLAVAVGTDPKGATSLNASATGAVAGSLFVGVADLASGTLSPAKAGPVTFNLNASGPIAAGGSLGAIGIGGKQRNAMSVNYTGANNGSLNVMEQAAGPKDDLAANLAMTATSTGTVGDTSDPAQVGSTGKGAKVRFAVFRGADGTTKAGINAQITMSNRKSTIAHTANVTNLAIGTETIIPNLGVAAG